jgi:glutamine synthetase type III
MMSMMKRAILPALLLVMASSSISVQAQTGGIFRRNQDRNQDTEYSQRTRQAVDSLQRKVNTLQEKMDRLLDRSRIDGTRGEDKINELFKNFRNAANRLEDRVNDDRAPQGEFRELFNRWSQIENFTRNHPNIARTLRSDLNTVRADMEQLQNMISNSNWRRR